MWNKLKWLKENVKPGVAESTRILYAGFVSADNCEELSRKHDIDGFLVGRALLKPEFVQIVYSKNFRKQIGGPAHVLINIMTKKHFFWLG